MTVRRETLCYDNIDAKLFEIGLVIMYNSLKVVSQIQNFKFR